MKNRYLQLLERLEIEPNFWCSEEYFQKAGLKEETRGDLVGIFDENTLVYPPLHPVNGITWGKGFPDQIWSDFVGFEPKAESTFLDYEYIYDPNHFLDMKGRKWMVFRKNSRKFSREKSGLVYLKKGLEKYGRKIQDLFISWLSRLEENTEIHDSKVMEKFILEGLNRRILVDGNCMVYGLNVWDENYMYINFRYCICENLPYLSEYMRLLFYIDMASKGKLVNDGGILDNPKLKFFKDKLNPINIREVKSWRREEEEGQGL